MADRNPTASNLATHSERDLLVKILAELRVQNYLMAQQFNATDDIGALRNDVMASGNKTDTDV